MGKYCGGGKADSRWEKMICSFLCRKHITHVHHPFEARIQIGRKTLTYTPDMLARGILIEPHGIIDDSFLQKMAAFREAYPAEKIVLIVRNLDIPRIPEGLYDEILPIEHHDLLDQVLSRIGTQPDNAHQRGGRSGLATPGMTAPGVHRGERTSEARRRKAPAGLEDGASLRALILDSRGETLRSTELLDKGYTKSTVRKVLRDLVKEGIVEQVGWGQFKVAQEDTLGRGQDVSESS